MAHLTTPYVRPPPKTIVGEIGNWYNNVVKHQVDYKTHKVIEARKKKLEEQAEMRRLSKPCVMVIQSSDAIILHFLEPVLP